MTWEEENEDMLKGYFEDWIKRVLVIWDWEKEILEMIDCYNFE